MFYHSTNKQSRPVDLKYAVLKGLADDGGLYMPQSIPQLQPEFWSELPHMSLAETGFRIARSLLESEVPVSVLKKICYDTLSFDIPLVKIDENVYTLELFHGPTMAFKDVGARFMSRLMSWFQQSDSRRLKVVVATSGDTGGAVAAGFYDLPGIDVYVLFPKGKVSSLQQKQITTWGKNINAIEVDGTFDDCQALAKEVLSDRELNDAFLITSANSINIARLIPQSFYYVWAAAQLESLSKPLVFSVPSGNFGNLTAGLMASAMGLPVSRFVAATNINDVVPQYYISGKYQPQPSVQTISNAMDVGNPSNYARMMELFENRYPEFCKNIYACAFSDTQTQEAIKKVLNDFNYLLDPHGAIGFLGAREYLRKVETDAQVVFLETAHPAKFPETLPIVMEAEGKLPWQLQQIANKQEKYVSVENSYQKIKQEII